MLMLQYQFNLPADYPMRIVRERIAARGPQFDTLSGLGWKAFLLRENGISGATDHQYAPLYLWPTPAAAAAFLAGPQFAGVCHAFGRPRVATPTLLRHQIDTSGHPPRWCTSEHQPLARLADLQMHLAAFDARVSLSRHSAWLALDPSRWILSCHQLWWGEQAPPARHATLYEVAHFSQPQ